MEGALLSRDLTNKFLKNKWHNGNNENFLFDDVLDLIGQKLQDHDIHVGTDSNPSKVPLTVALTIALIKPRAGGHYYWTKIKLPIGRDLSLHERLSCEAEVSCNIGERIKERYPGSDITIHVDVNSSTAFASGKYAKQLTKFVRAFGFFVVIKPLSWAASSVADRHAY